MKQVFIAPPNYTMNDANPFTEDGGYDRSWTILTIDTSVKGMLFQQRTRHGCYAVSMTPAYIYFPELFADFIQYETDHGRKIILVSETIMSLDFMTHYKETSIRPSDARFLVHSTMLPNYQKIILDGMLKSLTRLISEGVSIDPIGLEPLGEPDDYLDHIMFSRGGVAPELVVNSRLYGRVNYDPNAHYTPQARLYFNGYKMISDGLIVRSVAPMAYGSVSLEKYLVRTVTAKDVALPDGDTCWTPYTFSKAADELMERVFPD